MAVTWQDGVGIAQMSPDDIWRQAMAEYDAKRQSTIEASPIDLNQGVYERRPINQQQQSDLDAFREELFAPLQDYTQALVQRARPGAADRPFQFRVGSTGEQTLFDPNNGTVKTVKEGRPQMGQREKIDYQDLLRQRNTLLGKQFLMDADRAKLAELEQKIKDASGPQAVLQPQPDPFSQDFGQPGKLSVPSAFIGGRGQPNRMDWGADADMPASGTAFAGQMGGENLFNPRPSNPGTTVTTKAQFDALPSGAVYTRNGKRYRKP